MGFFKRILFPVDLSEASKKIVPYVKEVMDKFGAELHIVRATNVTQYYVAAYAGEAMPAIMAEEEKNIRAFISSHLRDIPVRLKMLPGPPGPEIIRYAEEENLDLIIMGHSSTGTAKAIFGSVARYVVRYSPVPVLIISAGMLKNSVDKEKWHNTEALQRIM